jgi:5-methylcytosine-specific restriction endonuclease McrA
MAKSKPGAIHQRIIEILKQFPEGRTCGQVRHELEKEGLRADEQTYLDKRMRELPRWFKIKKTRAVASVGNKRQSVVVYAYDGERETITDEGQISQKLQYEVIHAAHGRCQECGKTIDKHGITLVVDHKKPRDWGGTNDRENLQALCEGCNGGKKAYFSSLDKEMMKSVMAHDSVHVRIGEMLKAVGVGNRTSPALLEAVANQEDWHKRLRELRYPVIGWKIAKVAYKAESGRKKVDYVLRSYQPWPDNPTATVGQFERDRKRRNLGRKELAVEES